MTSTGEQISTTTKANIDAAIKRGGNGADQVTSPEQIAKANNDILTKGNTDALTKGNNAANQMAAIGKDNADALTRSGSATINGFQELTKAYQGLAIRNAEKLTASIQAFSAVKTPAEFVDWQANLITESLVTAVNDWSNLAKLKIAVFTSAFEPVRKQVEGLQAIAKH